MDENEIDYQGLEVDKENSAVSYNDKLHKYWTKDTHQSCISVTTLIKRFDNFDEEFWASYKALQAAAGDEAFLKVKKKLLDTKIFNSTSIELCGVSEEDFQTKREEILKEWATKRDESCVRGTLIHREHELGHLGGESPEVKKLGLGGTFTPNITNKIELGVQKVYPEILLSWMSEDGKLRIAGQADLIIIDGDKLYVLDYKGLALDTPILTTKGYKLLKDITKNDVIFDKDGNKTNILNISEIHNNPCYKITFDNGDELIADHEHRWLTSFRRSKGVYKEQVMTTEELKEVFNKYESTKNGYWLPKIMNAKPLQTEKANLPIDPYLLGYWLGDGTSVAGSITCVRQEFWDEIEKRGYTYGKDISENGRAELRAIEGLRTELRKLDLLENKHIPSIYLLSSYEQRLDLLRGFMDANGHYNPTRKRFVMTTTREYQADYLVSILSTLGIKPSKLYAKKYCNGKEFDGWDVCFTMSENPFLIRNQEDIEFPNTDKASFRNIKSIELVETVETKCLEVDSPSHTFLAGYSLIPTHNTNKKIEQKSFYDTKTRKSTMMKYPLNNLEDTNFWHYTLQLSTYAWMIKQAYPEVEIKKLMLIHYDHDGNCTDYECDYLEAEVIRMLSFYKKEIEHDEFKNKRKKIQY